MGCGTFSLMSAFPCLPLAVYEQGIELQPRRSFLRLVLVLEQGTSREVLRLVSSSRFEGSCAHFRLLSLVPDRRHQERKPGFPCPDWGGPCVQLGTRRAGRLGKGGLAPTYVPLQQLTAGSPGGDLLAHH